MSANFSFDVDARRNLVLITLGGFFSRADVDAFLAAREVAHARLRCGPNEHVTLADVRAMKIQAQDIVVAWGDVLSGSAYRSRRLAFVQASSLARLQLKRAAAMRDVGYFTSMADAEAWLFEEEHAIPERRSALG
ncbi:MAG: hypothetical protein H2054_02420 [Sphingomonas sp.]|uniref:hypothetical protein n=1 Tax=Sphingomonas sp. TaxID=28214 RepID=UPI000DB47A59|nr:hypothetical protein [Zymomonas sp.]MBA4771949.1 hypothetical protein [Sphingomonas sp.]PZP16497.1 MAG: hypothetical protein DI607_07205 [Sphingomonas hengshuiensis]